MHNRGAVQSQSDGSVNLGLDEIRQVQIALKQKDSTLGTGRSAGSANHAHADRVAKTARLPARERIDTQAVTHLE